MLIKAKALLFTKILLPKNHKLSEENYLSILSDSYPRINQLYLTRKNEIFTKLSQQSKKHRTEMRNDLFVTLSKLHDCRLSNDITDQLLSTAIEILAEIDAEIDLQGGLHTYQVASLNGQDKLRGSDSSKKLIEWLTELCKSPPDLPLTALEIGSLSSKNQISTSKWFKDNVTRIDLNSQDSDTILQQDFMQRPLPKSEKEKYHLISCSLVLNFVSSAQERGEMLKRIGKFFKPSKDIQDHGIFPCFFFVLPLPCVTNSKYINKENILPLLNG